MSENEGSKLNKFSFYVIGAIAILYVVTMILSLVHIRNVKIIPILSAVAAACTIIIVSILAWRFVKNKTMVWKVLYFVFMALVMFGACCSYASTKSDYIMGREAFYKKEYQCRLFCQNNFCCHHAYDRVVLQYAYIHSKARAEKGLF